MSDDKRIIKTEFEPDRKGVNPAPLYCGCYEATENGILFYKDKDKYVPVIDHPLTIDKRLRNQETGKYKLRLAYKRRDTWHYLTVDRSEVASISNIIKLADYDISVNQTNAREVIKYLSFLETENLTEIKQVTSCSHLGYPFSGALSQFLPYADSDVMEFDGDKEYKSLFDAVGEIGSFDVWKDKTAKLVSGSLPARIAIVASFASVLIEPYGSLPFFVHLWGRSGTGKSVILKGAASVWANPSEGKYIQTFNATDVGHERMAEFLRNMPFIIDELQLTKDRNGKVKYDPYRLAEGIGKTRGNQRGGVDHTPSWRLALITSGETPMFDDNAASGAKNRVIEINIDNDVAEQNVLSDYAESVKQNYGHAGKMFVEWIVDQDNREKAESIYRNAIDTLRGFTGKQTSSAALLLTADRIATDILHLLPGEPLTVEQIGPFLKTEIDIDVNPRLYDRLCDWIHQNMNSFAGKPGEGDAEGRDDTVERGQLFGRYDAFERIAYIIPSVFHDTIRSFNGNPKSFISWLIRNDHLKTPGGKTRGDKINRRLNGDQVLCYAVRLPFHDAEEVFPEDDAIHDIQST